MTDSDAGGQLRRQCTGRWKIDPIRRTLRDELRQRGVKSPKAGAVEMWMGISLDEWDRARSADVAYIANRYPLLERKMRRQDCVTWLLDHALPVPPKSACTFCPYHNRRAWAEMKRAGGPDWEQAVKVDQAIREKRPPFGLFLHRDRIPLVEAVRIPEDHGYSQGDLFGDEDDDGCATGVCFV